MPLHVNLNDLLDYTDWERQKWYTLLRHHGADTLRVNAGPHGDGRFRVVGDLIRHIFSAEKRYIDRLAGRPLTETASVPSGDIEALFQFGRESRNDLRLFLDQFPNERLDVLQEFPLMNSLLRATPRKILIHVVMHEVRHWAQIATLLRLHGITDEFHDFLFSPVLGGDFTRAAIKT